MKQLRRNTASSILIPIFLIFFSICILSLTSAGAAESGAVSAGSKTSGIRLAESKKVLYLGPRSISTFSISYTLKQGLTGKVRFSSDHPEVAKVTSKGKVFAIGTGTARIHVKVGTVSAACLVRVKKPVFVRTSPYKVSLQLGESLQVGTRMVPEGGIVRYASSNPSVAKVTSKGLIKARSAGVTYISMKCYGITRKMIVRVKDRVYIPSIKKISWKGSWPYASFSKIHSGTVKLYQSPFSRGKTVAVNAGHGTNGGSDVYTLSHPDGSPKVTGGSTAAGSVYSTAVSDGTVFLDGTTEAEATLSLALLLKDKLLRAGYDVLMIRETQDQQLDNIARTVLANQFADCHIALHYDSSEYDKGAFYISVPAISSYRNMEPVASHWREHNRLGESLLKGFRSKQLRLYSDGTMDIDLTQTSYSTIPSVDLEVGDCASDHSQAAQSRIADAIVSGVKVFFGS